MIDVRYLFPAGSVFGQVVLHITVMYGAAFVNVAVAASVNKPLINPSPARASHVFACSDYKKEFGQKTSYMKKS